MYRYIIKRILWLIPILLGVSFIVFTICTYLQGSSDDDSWRRSIRRGLSSITYRNGVYQSFIVQFLNYVRGVVLNLIWAVLMSQISGLR